MSFVREKFESGKENAESDEIALDDDLLKFCYLLFDEEDIRFNNKDDVENVVIVWLIILICSLYVHYVRKLLYWFHVDYVKPVDRKWDSPENQAQIENSS